MADRLSLSCWLQGFNESNMLDAFAKFLGAFPFSRLSRRGALLRVFAVKDTEPPLLEREFGGGSDAELLVEAASEFMKDDCCCQVEAAWDLWQFDGEWKLGPSTVTLFCFGPEFENEVQDHLRIEFGADTNFLPPPHAQGGLRMVQSNLESLKTLLSDIEKNLRPERVNLWSESGVNFGEALQRAIASFQVN